MISDRFRGKSLRDGGWVYGSLIRDCNGKPMIHVAGYGATGGGFETRYIVEEKTIGQFIGEFDRNGREIYDDDLLRTEQPPGGILPPAPATTGKVEFNAMHGLVVKFRREGHDFDSYIRISDRINEVVGNIHDNPELITT